LATLEHFQGTAVNCDLMIIVGHFIAVAFKNLYNLLNLKITGLIKNLKN
jgi:hypothetical protein